MARSITNQYKCPFPGCNHTFLILTNNHCEKAHGMTRKQVERKYGRPIPLDIDPKKYRKNMARYKASSVYYSNTKRG